jgi:hypothetical protein
MKSKIAKIPFTQSVQDLENQQQEQWHLILQNLTQFLRIYNLSSDRTTTSVGTVSTTFFFYLSTYIIGGIKLVIMVAFPLWRAREILTVLF